MGFGDSEFGVPPFGGDVAPDVPAARPTSLPRAILFDGSSRTFPRDADGRLIDIHPVDQEVALAVLLVQGGIASSPATGSTLRSVESGADGGLQIDVERRLTAALARPLAAGDIRIIWIRTRIGPRWRTGIHLRYQNLRDPDAPIRDLNTLT